RRPRRPGPDAGPGGDAAAGVPEAALSGGRPVPLHGAPDLRDGQRGRGHHRGAAGREPVRDGRRHHQRGPVLQLAPRQPLGGHPGLGPARHRLLPRGGGGRAAVRGVAAGGAVASPSAPMAPIIALDGVGKTYPGPVAPTEALDNVSLAVERGEFVSLIGPSGCGKSTLLRIVGDLVPPSAGTVTVNGKPPRPARPERDYG